MTWSVRVFGAEIPLPVHVEVDLIHYLTWP